MTRFKRGPNGGWLATCDPETCLVCLRARMGYYDGEDAPDGFFAAYAETTAAAMRTARRGAA